MARAALTIVNIEPSSSRCSDQEPVALTLAHDAASCTARAADRSDAVDPMRLLCIRDDCGQLVAELMQARQA